MSQVKSIRRDQVFLVQGQLIAHGEVLSGFAERVLVAETDLVLQEHLGEIAAEFRATGWASLKDYEDAAAKIRLSLKEGGSIPVMLLLPKAVEQQ